MQLERPVLLATLLTSWTAAPVSAEDKLNVSGSKSEVACACPKEGRWNAQNLEGWMDCTGPVNFRKPLDKVKDKGTIWVVNENCSEVFGEASRKDDEDVLLTMQDDCTFAGRLNGDEDGVKMVIDMKWELENDEFIKGEMHSNPSLQGMMCEYFRPYELRYDEPIPAGDYEKLREKMGVKLEEARKRDGRPAH